MLRKNEVQVAAAKLQAFLASERGAESAQPLGHVRRLEAEGAPGRECGEHVIAVVQAAQLQLESRGADIHGQVFEAAELDVGRSELGLWAREVAVRARVHAVVAD